jgi:TRAP-type C4-dicarboxylate transport system permease small subunit
MSIDVSAAAPGTSSAGSEAVPLNPPARWGEPIAAADRIWTRFEVWLAMTAFALEATSMVLWVCLKGFSASPEHPSAIVFRSLFGATVLGSATYVALGKRPLEVRRAATIAAVVVGALSARFFLNVGRDYSSNLLNWYQQASFLTLLGGLRGVGTRLTMLLALVGGSLATARGRHIVIDILTRFVGPRVRKAMVLVGWAGATVVCMIAAWGFFDHLAIESFGADSDASARQKIAAVAAHLDEDFFIARQQIRLDMKSVPHVLLRGEVYSDFLTGKEWGAWLDTSGFSERYGTEATNALKIPDADTRAPLVVVPGRGEPRGELINAAYLVFPIGLFVIGMRFLVRGLLVMSGHATVESDESDEGEI